MERGRPGIVDEMACRRTGMNAIRFVSGSVRKRSINGWFRHGIQRPAAA
jgi:hypothetical protein